MINTYDYFAKHEEICTVEKTKMIIMNLKVDNFFAFKNFSMNFSYPKKIVGSNIEDEFLSGHPNFRYKKVNIIMGANASGKTSLGKVIQEIFHFIDSQNISNLVKYIDNKLEYASFQIDLVSSKAMFYRVSTRIAPKEDGKYLSEDIDVEIKSEKIGKNDSYEMCCERLEVQEYEKRSNYIDELSKIDKLFWYFQRPGTEEKGVYLPKRSKKFTRILSNILISLDPSIHSVENSGDVEDAYIINLNGKKIIIQNNEPINSTLLSSGTKEGIAVASLVNAIMEKRNSFYYCDEKFSYIHSDLEQAILALMINAIGENEQLFFTTHNTDILSMDLPKHSFYFLKKDIYNENQPIECINASTFLKRNTDSLRKAIENDLFSTAPSVDLIYSLEDDTDIHEG